MIKGAWLLAGTLGGLICGWALGYLRLPYIRQNLGFYVGLLTGMALLALVLIIRRSIQAKEKPGRSFLISGVFLASVFGLGILGIFIQSQRLQQRYTDKELQIRRDFILNHQQQQQHLASLMMDFLWDVRQELQENPARKLRDTTISRMARISESFQPYLRLNEGGSDSILVSPERGQLMEAVLSMEMDSTTFSLIRKRVTFAHAELSGLSLKGIDLSHGDFRSANFRNTQLTGGSCRNCDLRRANFTGAILNRVDFTDADMRRVVFHWTEAKESIFRHTYLDGADLSHAVLSRSDLSESIFQWGEMGGANLTGTTATEVDFMKTGMKGVIFARTNLTNSNMRRTDVAQASFMDAILDGVSVNEGNWIQLLQTWSVSGANEINARYSVEPDTVVRYQNSQYILLRRSDLVD